MSEPMFPSSAADAAPAVPEPVQSGGGNRTALFVAGGLVAALVVGAGAFFMLGSGGGADEPLAAPAKGKPAASASPTPGATTKAKPTTTIKTVTVAARDPFAVLFPPTPTPKPKASSTTQVQTSTSAPTPLSPKVTLAVSRISTGKQSATVTVDGVQYATTVGKVFGKSFVMYSVFNSSCVGLLYGDQNVAVCTTAPVSVSA